MSLATSLFPIKRGIIVVFFIFSMVFSSCLSRKNIDYFQNGDGTTSIALPQTYEPIILPNDLLEIQVASINPEAAKFFNPSNIPESGTNSRLNTYLVDSKGEIELPLIGSIKVAGMTTRQIKETLKTSLEKYLQSPTVKVNFESYKITILGEVKLPGLYQVRSEKINITEALGLAGDMTIFGDRKKVMIIREQDGKKEFIQADLTTRDIFATNYYYLHPGDVVYVPAGKGRIASADAFYRVAPLVISTLTLISLIFFRVNN